MKVFSLFSGIGGFELGIQQALGKENVDIVGYSEIDKFACAVYECHFPGVKNYGDVTKIDSTTLPEFDVLVGGSPCTDLSVAKMGREGLQGERSKLFWEYVRILQATKPKWFVLENVASMKDSDKDIITNTLGVEPICINSSLLTAQNRKRLYRTNIPGVKQPEDRGILLKDILENGVESSGKIYSVSALCDRMKSGKNGDRVQKLFNVNPSGNGMNGNVYDSEGKAPTLTTNKGEGPKIVQRGRGYNHGGIHEDKCPTLTSNSWQENNKLVQMLAPNKKIIRVDLIETVPTSFVERRNDKGKEVRKQSMKNGIDFTPRGSEYKEYVPTHSGKSNCITTSSNFETYVIDTNYYVRKLTCIECERLQGFPDGRTLVPRGNRMMSDSQRYRQLGNAVTVPVIEHIFKCV